MRVDRVQTTMMRAAQRLALHLRRHREIGMTFERIWLPKSP